MARFESTWAKKTAWNVIRPNPNTSRSAGTEYRSGKTNRLLSDEEAALGDLLTGNEGDMPVGRSSSEQR